MSFPSISPKQSFPALESKVLAYWKANNTFQKSIESRPAENPYRFYDGPPFITGMPHYGHMLGSAVKDCVGRYWTMRGRRVDRVWGWDCHGLPIEEKVQKKLGLKSNKEIEAHGVKDFIDECYKYTGEVSSEWNWYIDKIGRWVDMEHAYRTMDQDYMESVMWVFSQLWQKGLIYEGKRVSLYSWKLSTPISNFEVAMDDTYQEVNDPAITVKFKIVDFELCILHQLQRIDTDLQLQEIDIEDINGRAFVWDKIEGIILNTKGEPFHVSSEEADQERRDNKINQSICIKKQDIIVAVIQYSIQDTGIFLWNIVVDEKWQTKKIGSLLLQYLENIALKQHKIVYLYSTDSAITFYEKKHYTRGKTTSYNLNERDSFLQVTYFEKHVPSISLLAWTTTPWTIPANMALAVGAEIEYVLVSLSSPKIGEAGRGVGEANTSPLTPLLGGEGNEQYIIAKNRVETVMKGKGEYEIIREFLGSDLVGLSYIPPFPEYYYEKGGEKNHHIYSADFATDTDGTGIVHIAPEFGEADFQLGKREGITITEAMDEAGKYTAQIHDYEGTHYLDANKINIERMKANNTLFKNEGVTHRVPFCPRSGTPLVQRAQSSWFIDIQSQKEKLLEANKQINWFPEYLKYGRFAKGIESAPDWCISRTRFWGAPMPVWMDESREEQVVVSSREEIYQMNKPYGQLTKQEIDGKVKYFFTGGEYDGTELNLHRPYIDSIRLQSPTTGHELTRIPEVLDVWMDSGSMPYAQMHYPFENRAEMEASFPADFIAEYVGQVRAWFYVMHVLGVLLNSGKLSTPTPSFTNVITTGVINGNDGRKMSKSYGNYPDPRVTIEKYGADPIRYYMLNSPLLSGGDMDFKEEGIVETIKSVMLPIWNTYSFFTTYANIDGWEKDETEVWFVRHAESESNVMEKMSDHTDNPDLTEKGREQAREAGRTLKEQGKNFDIIILTDRIRTRETARLITEELDFSGEIIIDDRFREQDGGEYAGKKLEDIAREHHLDPSDHEGLRRLYKNNSTENITQFESRIISAYEEIVTKYRGKKILIIGHAGTTRPILSVYFGKGVEKSHYNTKIINAEPFRLVTTPLSNPLDRWILSQLQVLMGQVHDAMDGYDISRATRAITEYMDEMTNWYIRLSRRRFWENGMTDDKRSAYETLHTVLVELSKLLAPYMPFLSESIYQGLTRKESVHLDHITRPSRHLIDHDLNRDMQICEQIVSLGLALRSRKNIRVRQPLQSVTITRELDEYYRNIIRDELNVKEVKYEKPENLATKICKPDARKIGPKYGKSVQQIITEAKNGNFIEKENGVIQVLEFTLETGEYTIEYLPAQGLLDVEGGYGMVIALDTEISESLHLEGLARDLIRAIQDMRKEADYQVTDHIMITLSGGGVEKILSLFESFIEGETLSRLSDSLESPDLMREIELDGEKAHIQMKR